MGRTFLFVVAIMLGVAMLTAMRIATGSVVTRFTEQMDRLDGRADLQVRFGTGETPMPEDVLYEVRKHAFVRTAAAVVRGSLTRPGNESETVELFGVDLLQRDVRVIYGVELLDRSPDDIEIATDPYGVFLTNRVLIEWELKTDDTIDLIDATGVHEYTIRGALADEGAAKAFDGRIAVMFLPAAQRATAKGGGPLESYIDYVDVVVSDDVDVDAAQNQLLGSLASGLTVAPPVERALIFDRTATGLRATLVGISAFALVAALFIIYSTTTAMVAARLPEMATLAMVGVTGKTLTRMILAETFLLGFAGAAIGAVVGAIAASYVVGDVASGMSLNYWIPFSSPSISVDWIAVLPVHALGGAVAATASAYVPARSLALVDPLDVKLRAAQETVGVEYPARILFWIGCLLVLAGILSLVYGVETGAVAPSSFGGVVLVFGCVVLVLPIVVALWSRVGDWCSASFGVTGQIVGENLNRGLARSSVLVAAISLCVAASVTAATLPHSFRESIRSWYGFEGDIAVVSRATRGGWLGAPMHRDVESELLGLESVKSVDSLAVSLGHDYAGERVAVVSLSSGLARAAFAKAERNVGGGSEALLSRFEKGAGAIVSSNFAKKFGKAVGDRVELSTPSGSIEFKVLGVVNDYTSDTGSVLVSRNAARRYWSDSTSHYIVASVYEDTDDDEFKQLLSKISSRRPDLIVMDMAAMVRRADHVIEIAFADIAGIQILVVVITLLGIFDLVLSNVLERRRELALLETVGATARTLRLAISGEAAIMGATAGALGAVIGVGYSFIWITFTYRILVGYVLELNISYLSAIVCVVLATLSATISGFAAARIVSRSSLIDALRTQ